MILGFETTHYYNQLILLKVTFSEVPTPVKINFLRWPNWPPVTLDFTLGLLIWHLGVHLDCHL